MNGGSKAEGVSDNDSDQSARLFDVTSQLMDQNFAHAIASTTAVLANIKAGAPDERKFEHLEARLGAMNIIHTWLTRISEQIRNDKQSDDETYSRYIEICGKMRSTLTELELDTNEYAAQLSAQPLLILPHSPVVATTDGAEEKIP